jgi:hypothetical protein
LPRRQVRSFSDETKDGFPERLHNKRDLVGLVLAVLFPMLQWLPIMYWQVQLADRQRAVDQQINNLLAPTPASAPA